MSSGTAKKVDQATTLTQKDSEIRYRRLFEAAQDGILMLDAETGMIDDVNPYLIKLLGYSHKEFVKKKLWEMGAFKDNKASHEAFKALQDDEYIRYENLPLKTKGGQLVQVEFISNVYLVGEKKVIQCNIRDVTEHKRIVAALQENEEIYHSLINQSPDGFFVIEFSGKIVAANQAMCRELGFTQAELLSMNVWEIIPEIYLDQYKSRLTKILKGKSLKDTAEYEVLGKDGKTHYVEVLSAPHYSGKEIIGFQGIARDITTRKQAEDDLRASEQRFHMASWATNDVIWERNFPTNTIAWNENLQKLFHFRDDEIEPTVAWWQDHIHPSKRIQVTNSLQAALDQGEDFWSKEYRFRLADGSYADVFDRGYILYDDQGKPLQMVGAIADITEYKRREQALQKSEERFRAWIENSSDLVTVIGVDGIIHYASPSYQRLLGYKPEELIGTNGFDLVHPADRLGAIKIFFENMQKNDGAGSAKFRIRHHDGSWRLFEGLGKSYLDENGETAGLINSRDITERQQTEDSLQESLLMIEKIINAIPTRVFWKDKDLVYLGCNTIFAQDKGFTDPTEVIGKDDYQIAVHDRAELLRADDRQVIESGRARLFAEESQTSPDGQTRTLLTSKVPLHDPKGDTIGVLGTYMDITERKQAEEALQLNEAKFRSYIEHAPLGVFIADRSGRYLEVNMAATEMLGYTEAELLHLSIPDVLAPQSLEAGLQSFQKLIQDGFFASAEFLFRHKDGTQFWVTVIAVKLSEDRFMSYCEDITERKQAELELADLAKFSSENPSPVLRLNRDGIVLYANAPSGAILDKWGCVVGGTAPQYWRDLITDALASKEIQIVDTDCEGKVFSLYVTPVADSGYVNIYGRDITERERSQEMIHRQLTHLRATSAIDQVIAANFDLKLSLSEILKHAATELGVDAVDILTLNPNSQTLKYAIDRGFRTKKIQEANVRLGESYAGRAALERKLIQISDIKNDPDNVLLKTFLKDEDFSCYFGVPLIAKGKVNGVMEVFHRTKLEPDAEWFEFLLALAGQAAIAIENSTLFNSLQRSNMELNLAYDATIEGWSHALDLRDKETEGHTQRVTEMTMKLAGSFGLSETELVHVRWGALLHDIGKMGVPDGILLKPGALTDEEWVLMKMHPIFAYQLLAPIRYLRDALDIPYCHHENWDGSGYPHGLKGEQIPLVARIFAVVDVWDALSSDRPYRAAWTDEEALAHIHASSGTHFDPQVVDKFMQLIRQQ